MKVFGIEFMFFVFFFIRIREIFFVFELLVIFFLENFCIVGESEDWRDFFSYIDFGDLEL